MMTKRSVKKSRPVGPGRLSAENSAQVEARILDAATALFVEHGYGDTTMDGIAKAAGASTKTVYSRYANKSEILNAAVVHMLDRAIAVRLDDISNETGAIDPRAYLTRVAHRLAGMYNDELVAGVSRVIIAEAYRSKELVAVLRDNHARIRVVLAKALQEWHDAKMLPHMRDAHAWATLFIQMVSSIPHDRGVIGMPMTRKEIDVLIADSIDLFLRGSGYTRP